jgi:hypothetical protein
MVEDKLEIKLLNDIEKYGLQVMRVLNEGASPGFSYSIGLFKTYILINNMAEDIKNGNVFEPLNYYTGILGDFKCYIVKVRPTNYDGYVGQAQRYYKNDDFPIVQCVYPTTKGIYPWEKSWPESIKDLQPILGEIK